MWTGIKQNFIKKKKGPIFSKYVKREHAIKNETRNSMYS